MTSGSLSTEGEINEPTPFRHQAEAPCLGFGALHRGVGGRGLRAGAAARGHQRAAASLRADASQRAGTDVRAGGWAAGSWTDGQEDGAFILQAQGGTGKEPAQDPCGSASAGLPPVILQDGCVS